MFVHLILEEVRRASLDVWARGSASPCFATVVTLETWWGLWSRFNDALIYCVAIAYIKHFSICFSILDLSLISNPTCSGFPQLHKISSIPKWVSAKVLFCYVPVGSFSWIPSERGKNPKRRKRWVQKMHQWLKNVCKSLNFKNTRKSSLSGLGVFVVPNQYLSKSSYRYWYLSKCPNRYWYQVPSTTPLDV